jgi:PAT family beta-lactamase induction signal transducer AmpG
VALGVVLTDRLGPPLARRSLGSMAAGGSTSAASAAGSAGWTWCALLLGMAFTLPLAAWAARRARFETLLVRPARLLQPARARGLPALIVLYKLGDAFRRSLLTPFLLKGMGYASAEVGVVNKVLGLWLTIGGALVGGALMLRLGLWRSLLLFGVLQTAQQPRLLVAGAGRQGAAVARCRAAGLRLGLRQAGRRPRRWTAAC